jgi:hypothetical protein
MPERLPGGLPAPDVLVAMAEVPLQLWSGPAVASEAPPSVRLAAQGERMMFPLMADVNDKHHD